MQTNTSFQDYFHLIMRRRWILFTFFLIIISTVFIGTLKMTPIYSSKTTLHIERKKPRVYAVQEVSHMGPQDAYSYKDYYETQYKLIQSNSNVSRVIERLKNDSNAKSYDLASLSVRNLLKNTRVTPVKGSQLVEISVENPDPVMASILANYFAEEYMKQNLEKSMQASNYAIEWLTKRVEKQRQELRKSEIALQKYRKENNINILPQMTDDLSGRDIKAEYTKIHALYASFSERYTQEHPKMVELNAQLQSLKNKIEGLEDSHSGNNIMEYRVLEREVATNKQMYEGLMQRLKEIDLSSSLDVTNISIIDRANPSLTPIKPNMKLNMILAAMVGIFMGIGLAFLVDFLDATIKDTSDVKNLLHAHCLGSIPVIIYKTEAKKSTVVHINPQSPISEAYRSIRTELLHSKLEENDRVILVTSAEAQSGKTLTGSNLAIALAQNGSNILFVDCDLRKPRVHGIFGLEQKKGMSDYLLGEVNTIDAVIKKIDIDNLSVITCGAIPDSPSELISSKKMEDFIKEAKVKFDFVIFDTPPVISVPDAVILADKVDGVIQVIRSGKSKSSLAVRANEKLKSVSGKMLGVVLNDVSSHSGEYYYNYYYKSYYGKKPKKDRKQRSENKGQKIEVGSV